MARVYERVTRTDSVTGTNCPLVRFARPNFRRSCVPGRKITCRRRTPRCNTSAQLWSDRSQRAGTLRRRPHPRPALTSVRLKHRRGVPCPRREIRQRRLVGEGELFGRPVEHGWLKASGAEPMYPPAPPPSTFLCPGQSWLVLLELSSVQDKGRSGTPPGGMPGCSELQFLLSKTKEWARSLQRQHRRL